MKLFFRLTVIPFSILVVCVLILNIFSYVFGGKEFLYYFPKLNNLANIWEKNLFSRDSKYKN